MFSKTTTLAACAALLMPYTNAAPANVLLEARATVPNYSGTEPAILFPWAAGSNDFRGSDTQLPITFGTRSFVVNVDTGTAGIMVPASWIPNFSATAAGAVRGFKYMKGFEGRGRAAKGAWFTTTFWFTDSAQFQRSVTLPVFGVTEACDCNNFNADQNPNALDCPANLKQNIQTTESGIEIYAPPTLGIGWGSRIASGTLPASVGTVNAFSKIRAIGPTRPSGWVMTRRGVYAGVDSTNTRDFKFQTLAVPNPNLSNMDLRYDLPKVSIKLYRPPSSPPTTLPVVFSTQSTSYFVTAPNSANLGLDYSKSVQTQLFDDANSELLSYIAIPQNVGRWEAKDVVRIGQPIFITRDCMYDSWNGVFGFRPATSN